MCEILKGRKKGSSKPLKNQWKGSKEAKSTREEKKHDFLNSFQDLLNYMTPDSVLTY